MNTNELRQQLTNLLTVRQAHMDFEDAVAGFPAGQINTRPPNCEYSFWHLLEHLRLAQRDILDYIRDPDYTWPDWPADYWPAPDSTADSAAWQADTHCPSWHTLLGSVSEQVS